MQNKCDVSRGEHIMEADSILINDTGVHFKVDILEMFRYCGRLDGKVKNS